MNWNKRVRSERRKSHFRGPRFQNFQGEDTPGPPYKCEILCMHQSAQELDPPLGHLGNLKVSGYPRFQHLSKVAQLVLVLPHSNAEEERAFSLVRKNKTCFRGNLDINRTLSAIMTIKMNSTAPCFEYKPTDEVVKNSKKVT